MEPRKTEMVRREMGPTDRGRGHGAVGAPYQASRRAARTVFRRILLDTPKRPVSNLRSGRPGGVPCTEFHPHLGETVQLKMAGMRSIERRTMT
jgi:hypothetical protein